MPKEKLTRSSYLKALRLGVDTVAKGSLDGTPVTYNDRILEMRGEYKNKILVITLSPVGTKQ